MTDRLAALQRLAEFLAPQSPDFLVNVHVYFPLTKEVTLTVGSLAEAIHKDTMKIIEEQPPSPTLDDLRLAIKRLNIGSGVSVYDVLDMVRRLADFLAADQRKP